MEEIRCRWLLEQRERFFSSVRGAQARGACICPASPLAYMLKQILTTEISTAPAGTLAAITSDVAVASLLTNLDSTSATASSSMRLIALSHPYPLTHSDATDASAPAPPSEPSPGPP